MCAVDRRGEHQRRGIVRSFKLGRPLAFAKDIPARPGVRQMVIISRGVGASAVVRVETYHDNAWDTTLEQTERVFVSLELALQWVETECAVHWSELAVPSPTRGGV